MMDGEPQPWCGSGLTYVKTTRAPCFEDYEIDYESRNQWAFLGNGKVRAFYDLVDVKPDGLRISAMTTRLGVYSLCSPI